MSAANVVDIRAVIFRTDRTDPGERPAPPRSGTRLGPGPVVRSDHRGGESTLRIEGALDALTVDDVKDAIESMVAERPHRVTVDLDRVSLLDSSGVSAIVSLWRRIKAQGGSVVLVHAHDQPLTVLRLLKLEALFGS